MEERDEEKATCPGVERWSVKTGTDPDASKVDLLHARKTTIDELRALDWPDPDVSIHTVLPEKRFAPTETTVLVLRDATLVCAKSETDQDFHLVVRQGSSTDNVEIPDPDCVGEGSPFAASIAQARADFAARKASRSLPKIPICKKTLDLASSDSGPISIVGVGFFDKVHGAIGGSDKQGVEIHPVLGVCFTHGCQPNVVR
jgi:hypothetical protein